ncbi:MAG: fatty acid oxidation complex subunit alpha FadB, partial [Xanthomonadales bacterium]|nr:fatty acid oxidation complex subunit alpha FadB [Xanthomonadales bacterium]
MIYQSDALSVKRLDGDIAELNFDLQGESVNKFDQKTVTSLTAALAALEAEKGIRGLLVTSAKPVFIVGADITEF